LLLILLQSGNSAFTPAAAARRIKDDLGSQDTRKSPGSDRRSLAG
jgi:hypothetical protein